MADNLLSTFQLVNEDRVISPTLVTIRQYGIWFEEVFDKYTAQTELYLKSKKKSGESVLEWHPGTRIGSWFDKQSNVEQSWLIPHESTAMARLVKLRLAEQKDSIPISVNDIEGRRMLRVYSTKQIELYIRSTIDKRFNIADYLSTPIQIKISNADVNKLIMPKVDTTRKKLF